MEFLEVPINLRKHRKHRAVKLEHIVETVFKKVLAIKLPKGIIFRGPLNLSRTRCFFRYPCEGMPEIAVIIPARWGSSRFPGKPLAEIAGKPLIQHVWERCRLVKKISRVIVATDDSRIFNAAAAFGAEVEMTSAEHQSGTDRIAEVAARQSTLTHVINVQGDEPLISPALIHSLAEALLSGKTEIVTAASEICDPEELENPNVVKVVFNRAGNALYFSRSQIPFSRSQPAKAFRHHGIYGYTARLLREFVSWPQSDLEKTEQLEQLRVLDRGVRIQVVISNESSIGVDVPGDIQRVEAELKS